MTGNESLIQYSHPSIFILISCILIAFILYLLLGGTGVDLHQIPPRKYYTPHSTMDRIFKLNLWVKQVNRPAGVEEIAQYSLNLTLEHNIGHIKELIWILSESYNLKPVFLKITYKDASLNDLDTLASIMGISEPPSNTEQDWGLIIDYTLFDSPFIPNKTPVLTAFEVVVDGPVRGELISFSSQYTLDTLLSTIEQNFKSKYDVQGNFVMVSESSEYDNDRLRKGLEIITLVDLTAGHGRILEEGRLCKSLFLDVTPLHPVRLSLVPTATIQLKPKQGGEATMYLTNAHESIHSMKEYLAGEEHDPLTIMLWNGYRVISAELSTCDSRRLVDALGYEFFSRESPALEYVCGRPKPVHQDMSAWEPELENSLEYYTLELNGSTIKFSTSDMIVNENDGYVLVNPIAYSRMANKFHVVAGDFANQRHLRTSGPVPTGINTGHSPPNAGPITSGPITTGPMTADPITAANGAPSGVVSGGPTSVPGHITPTPTSTATPTGTTSDTDLTAPTTPEQELLQTTNYPLGTTVVAQDVQEPIAQENLHAPLEQPPIAQEDADQPNPDRSVFEVISRLLMANRQRFARFGVEIVIGVFIIGYDFLFMFFKMEILVFLLVISLFVLFFHRGREASEWLDRNLLANAPPNQLDFVLVRDISRLMLYCNRLDDRIWSGLLQFTIKVLQVFIPRRYQWLAQESCGDRSIWNNMVEFAKESIGTGVLFFATLLPFIQEGVEEFLLRMSNSEAKTIINAIETILNEPRWAQHNQLFKRTVQSQFGANVDEFLAQEKVEEYEEILQLLKLWTIVNRLQKVFLAEVEKLERGSTDTIFEGVEDINSTSARNEGADSDDQNTPESKEAFFDEIVRAEGASGMEVSEIDTVITQR